MKNLMIREQNGNIFDRYYEARSISKNHGIKKIEYDDGAIYKKKRRTRNICK